MLLSGYWLSYEFDLTNFLWFMFGVVVTLAEEILAHCLFIWRNHGK